MKLRDLKPGDKFIARFYATDAPDDEPPILVINGEYLCPSENCPDMCICRFDGICVGYEPTNLEVEKIEGE